MKLPIELKGLSEFFAANLGYLSDDWLRDFSLATTLHPVGGLDRIFPEFCAFVLADEETGLIRLRTSGLGCYDMAHTAHLLLLADPSREAELLRVRTDFVAPYGGRFVEPDLAALGAAGCGNFFANLALYFACQRNADRHSIRCFAEGVIRAELAASSLPLREAVFQAVVRLAYTLSLFATPGLKGLDRKWRDRRIKSILQSILSDADLVEGGKWLECLPWAPLQITLH